MMFNMCATYLEVALIAIFEFLKVFKHGLYL